MDSWYKAFGAVAGVVALGLCSYYFSRLIDESFKSKINSPQIQNADLNGNGRFERFYTIEGRVAVTEVDGEPIIDFLNKRK